MHAHCFWLRVLVLLPDEAFSLCPSPFFLLLRLYRCCNIVANQGGFFRQLRCHPHAVVATQRSHSPVRGGPKDCRRPSEPLAGISRSMHYCHIVFLDFPTRSMVWMSCSGPIAGVSPDDGQCTDSDVHLLHHQQSFNCKNFLQHTLSLTRLLEAPIVSKQFRAYNASDITSVEVL